MVTQQSHLFQAGRLLRMRGAPVGHGGDQGKLKEAKGDDAHEVKLSSGPGASGGQLDWGWGATVDLHKKVASKAGEPAKYELSVLVMCKKEDSKRASGQPDPSPTPTANGVQVATLACALQCARPRSHVFLLARAMSRYGLAGSLIFMASLSSCQDCHAKY